MLTAIALCYVFAAMSLLRYIMFGDAVLVLCSSVVSFGLRLLGSATCFNRLQVMDEIEAFLAEAEEGLRGEDFSKAQTRTPDDEPHEQRSAAAAGVDLDPGRRSRSPANAHHDAGPP